MLVIEISSVFHLYDLQIGFSSPRLKAPAGRHAQPDVLLLHLMDCGCELLIDSRYVAT